MVPRAPTSNTRQLVRHEPLFDIHPRTGTSIEVFYADRTLETFGRCGAGWLWQSRRHGFAAKRLELIAGKSQTRRHLFRYFGSNHR